MARRRDVDATFNRMQVARAPPQDPQASSALQYTVTEVDPSDDEGSDVAPQTRGRVSPSPYTANTPRAKEFNTYVRGVVTQKLDVMVPISHQPRQLISEIIADASAHFPDFSSCVRKRIRTLLKSFRRSKKGREGQTEVNGGSSFSPWHTPSPTPHRDPSPPTSPPLPFPHLVDLIPSSLSPSLPSSLPSSLPHSFSLHFPPSSPLNTLRQDHDHDLHDPSDLPHKRLRLDPSSVAGGKPHPLATPTSCLSGSEMSSVQQLITGYRESAAFLLRAADQLEAMLDSRMEKNHES